MPDLVTGTADGRLVIDNSAPALDGDAYTLSEVVKPPPAPELAAIYPTTFVIGSPDALLHCFGQGFDRESRILVAGNVERTTYVAPGHLTTWINSESWQGPDPDVPVAVRTGAGDTDEQALAIVAS